ncbi:hypothetical protein AB205_0012120 [Aquarana catesbeiana]|uniref:Uncharacterized protein n=1 Tax=Aquarana catesbeiana TaxID=8400 RepID=A0A2G9Q0T6_AQUCT|nr:hypothetical protein AB205_0012120 [Aquarana catesbeiana]
MPRPIICRKEAHIQSPPKASILGESVTLSIPFFFHIWEKRLGGYPSSEETRDPPPLEEGEIPQTQEEQEEDVVELVTTTVDRDVVDPDPFTSESAQILNGEIMGCNVASENI